MSKIMNFEPKDVVLAVVFAIIGYFTSTEFVTIFVDKLGPVMGMMLTGVFVIGALIVLSLLDLIIFKFKYDGFTKAIGLILITFAFFIVTSQSSCYQNMVLGKNCDVCSSYFQSPDGAVWHLISGVLPTHTALGLQTVRILTYVVVPAILALLGGMLVKGSPQMEM